MKEAITKALKDRARLQALKQTALLDSPADPQFDRLTRLAARLLAAPVALVSLVDEDRQFFKSCTGLKEPYCSARQTPLSHSFCQHVLCSGKPLVISDARQHPDFRDNPAIRDIGVIAYLGIPLLSSGGYVLGSFCVIDGLPRVWNPDEVALLEDLAALVITEIELRVQISERQMAEEVRSKVEELARSDLEKALQRRENIYRDLVETSNDLIWAVDVEGRWTFVNRKAALRIYGYEPDEMLGRPFTDFQTAEQAKKDLEVFASLKNDGSLFQYETTHLRKDGRPVMMRYNALVVHDENGVVIGTTGTASDVTEYRNLEAQARHAQKMDAIGQLAGGIAHDFNNLLTIILGSSELLRVQLGETDDAVQSCIETIRSSSERGADLTRQLLTFSRGQGVVPVVLNINVVLKDMLRMLKQTIGESISLSAVLFPDLWNVRADPGQIGQVLLNLVVNARDAMPGGGKLTIETANVTLDAQYARMHSHVSPGRHVMLAVSDSGRGMDAVTQSRIFEPFFTTKGPGKGTGLGLSTVYGIIKQSNGHIWVYSEPGRGSTFKIYFPQSDASTEAPLLLPEMQHVPVGTETILLVEDERAVREVVDRFLKTLGYTVLACHSAADARTVFEEHQTEIRLLLTDVVMPGESGHQLARELAGKKSDLRVMFMSGYTDNALNHSGEITPGSHMISKPFNMYALARKVREVIDAAMV